MYRTDDPIADFLARQRDIDERLERYPICECCGERIQDEKLYYIDGRFYCEECIEDCHKYTEDFED
jgi:RNA polymerase-binding transcription factor DksA